jgi:hypothetical protein
LRKTQKFLGQSNDDAKGEILAADLEQDGVRLSMPLVGRRHKKRLIQTASAAYRKLAALKPIKIRDLYVRWLSAQ